MKTSTRTTVVSLLAAVALITSTSVAFAQETKTLKEALKDKFLIGTAVNTRQASGRDKAGVRVIQEQFNAIVAENCMKSQEMHPKENRYNFTQADEFVAFGELGQILNTLDYRTGLMMAISLTGFANISSMGICISGISVFCPEKRGQLAELAFRGMIGGFCVSVLSALIVGAIVAL